MSTRLVCHWTCALALLAALPAGAAEVARRTPAGEADPKAVADFSSYLVEAAFVLAEQHVRSDVTPGQMAAWAVRGLFEGMGERVPADLQPLLDRPPTEKARLKELLAEARQRAGRRKALERWRDIDLALGGLFARLEPGFKHPSQEECRDRWICGGGSSRGQGIGVELTQDPTSGSLRVVTPLPGSPALKAGVKAGDLILSIHHGEGADAAYNTALTKGLSPIEGEGFLRGAPETSVRLHLVRGDPTKPLSLTVPRGPVEIETVEGLRRRSDGSCDFLADPRRGIGYVRINSLGRTTAEEVGRALDALQGRGLRGLVLDLRGNPIGLLSAMEGVADLLVDDGRLLGFHVRGEPVEWCTGRKEGSRLGFPIVCLIDRDTTSSAELLAACLQDHGRAVLAGERTAGNLAIRNVRPVSGSELTFATAVFCRPSGRNVSRILARGKDDWGVHPDRGMDARLTDAERSALADHFHSRRLIPAHDTGPEVPAFRDRLLELALANLRRRIE